MVVFSQLHVILAKETNASANGMVISIVLYDDGILQAGIYSKDHLHTKYIDLLSHFFSSNVVFVHNF